MRGDTELSENGIYRKEIATMKQDSMYRGLESNGQAGNRLAKPPPEEPDAGNLHVRVCEGPGRQRPGLLGRIKDRSPLVRMVLATLCASLV
jgi:hypothetical protein